MGLPLRDAVRTSTLSKKWSHKLCKLPELTLDQTLCETRKDSINPTNIFRKIIHSILTLLEGPITKFSLSTPTLSRCPKIDESLFYFISRNGIQHLVLRLPFMGKPYKLPCSFFTCFQLRHLTLECCSILHPQSFKGFDRLISLELRDAIISSKSLESFISHCPLLQKLVLKTSNHDSIEVNAPLLKSFDFTGLIEIVLFWQNFHLQRCVILWG
ncbi:hypothetical protein RND71_023143 [Anisodus tanguticus]|uniref:F-box/LRR-repeat protein 15/At3g58940/PEG3-like LRR domain-containing protein n=1 Tax=Anisodus tanguticus TaxID=243964 RepID=A0AAE1V5S9_9SOLA|nr:hypothetical protein RND71_023143 [Anisodus tanguticus]